MVQARTLVLTSEQRQTLQHARDHHAKAYLRERAAALLKVSSGLSVRWVARHGLLKPHKPRTVSQWMDRFEQDGLDGLLVQAGRGRKPVFSPSPRQHRNCRPRDTRHLASLASAL